MSMEERLSGSQFSLSSLRYEAWNHHSNSTTMKSEALDETDTTKRQRGETEMHWVSEDIIKPLNPNNPETYFLSVSSITWANESPSLGKPVQNVVSVSYKINSQLMYIYQRSHTKLICSHTSKASQVAAESKTSSLTPLLLPPKTKETPLPKPPTKNSGRVSLKVLESTGRPLLRREHWPPGPLPQTPPCQHRDEKDGHATQKVEALFGITYYLFKNQWQCLTNEWVPRWSSLGANITDAMCLLMEVHTNSQETY